MSGLGKLGVRWGAMAVFYVAVVGLAGCSDAPTEVADNVPAGNGVCLRASDIDHAEGQDDNSIVFVMKDGKVWLNTLRFPCAGLQLERGFDYVPEPGQICSNQQTIRVAHTGNLCELGQFVPAPVLPTAPLNAN